MADKTEELTYMIRGRTVEEEEAERRFRKIIEVSKFNMFPFGHRNYTDTLPRSLLLGNIDDMLKHL